MRAALQLSPDERQLRDALQAARARSTQLDQTLNAERKAHEQTRERLITQNGLLSRQATEIARLQTRALPAVDSDRLMQPDGQQAYALGILLGEDIRTAEQTHEALGLATDRALMLAGVMDGLQARYRLPPATRGAALAVSANDIRR